MVPSIHSSHEKEDAGPERRTSSAPEQKFRPEVPSKKGPAVTVEDNLPAPGSSSTLVEKDEVIFWNPKSLSRPVLGAFTALFVIMLASLQVIDSHSARHHGLATPDQSKHYLWTYGPTASELLLHPYMD